MCIQLMQEQIMAKISSCASEVLNPYNTNVFQSLCKYEPNKKVTDHTKKQLLPKEVLT